MTAMRAVGYQQLPPHAHVRELETEYVIELDVADFTEGELDVELIGPVVTVHGDQAETPADEGIAFRIHERLEESFRLPDDADLDDVHVTYSHGVLEFQVPRVPLTTRTLTIAKRRQGLLDPNAEGV